MAAGSGPLSLRSLARAGARLLPRSALARIADFRFGYAGSAHHFQVTREGSEAEPVLCIDGTLRLHVTADFAPDIDYHFVQNGESTHEMHAFMTVAAALPPGALLIDVGAHKGLFALVYCAARPGHRALLLEPSPSAAATAARAVERNGFSGRAEVLRCGAADHESARYVTEDGAGFAVIADTPSAGATRIDFVTIDAECRRRGVAPALIKIDVEGAEAEVLRGAMTVMRTAKPIVFLELHLDALEQRGDGLGAIVDMLQQCGYRFESVDGTRLSRLRLLNSLRAIQRIIAR